MLGGFLFLLPVLFVMGDTAFMLGDFSADASISISLSASLTKMNCFLFKVIICYDLFEGYYLRIPSHDAPLSSRLQYATGDYSPLPPSAPPLAPGPGPPAMPDAPYAPPAPDHFDSSNAAVNIFVYAVGKKGGTAMAWIVVANLFFAGGCSWVDVVCATLP